MTYFAGAVDEGNKKNEYILWFEEITNWRMKRFWDMRLL